MGRVLIGATGGIAAYKLPDLVRTLRREDHEVRVVATPAALQFVSALALEAVSGHPVRSELFEPGQESEISHIEIADWPEVVLVAPATAHTLARLAHGLADDLMTTVLLATRAPVIVAPAMNVNMYRHPATQANLDLLAKRGVSIVGPDAGDLACGWEGEGRLVDASELAGAVARELATGGLRDEVVIVTAGPTEEAIDPVRVLTNRSSGKMGFAVAAECARRGAEVLLIAGPTSEPTPHGVERLDVRSAREMRDGVLGALERATIVIKTAAVADYRVADVATKKLKRTDDTLELRLVPNPDIAAEVGARKGHRLLVCFAAETHDVLSNARGKLERKGCDLIVANDVGNPEIGIGSDRNEVTILGPGPDDSVYVPAAPKHEVARRVVDRIEQVRGS